jgi:Flp pilus assembly protein TadG
VRRPAAGDDSGSVTVLVLGMLGVLLGVVALVVDTSALVLARRAVASAADGAASAAAQQVDEQRVLDEGVGAAVPLDPAAVGAVVGRYEVDAREAQPGLELLVTTTGDRATVSAQRTVRLPLTGRRVVVTATTTVTSPVR